MANAPKSRHGKRFRCPTSPCKDCEIRRAVADSPRIIGHRIARRSKPYPVGRGKSPAGDDRRPGSDDQGAGGRVVDDRDHRPTADRAFPGEREQRRCVLNRAASRRPIDGVVHPRHHHRQQRGHDDEHDTHLGQGRPQPLAPPHRPRTGDHSPRCAALETAASPVHCLPDRFHSFI
jgi:hypothetical protein